LFQFLGCTEVDQPKGIEVVKEGIRKLKFSQQIKKAEGSKTPKVSARLTSDGCFLNFVCAKMHHLTSDGCFLNF
jgi:hypothetical protein